MWQLVYCILVTHTEYNIERVSKDIFSGICKYMCEIYNTDGCNK